MSCTIYNTIKCMRIVYNIIKIFLVLARVQPSYRIQLICSDVMLVNLLVRLQPVTYFYLKLEISYVFVIPKARYFLHFQRL